MPIVQIYILEGRTTAQKRKLVSSVTAAICESIDVPAEKVKIIITDMPNNNYANAGVLVIDEGLPKAPELNDEQEVE